MYDRWCIISNFIHWNEKCRVLKIIVLITYNAMIHSDGELRIDIHRVYIQEYQNEN